MTWYHEERENRFSAIETSDSWWVAFACHLLLSLTAPSMRATLVTCIAIIRIACFFIFQNEENK